MTGRQPSERVTTMDAQGTDELKAAVANMSKTEAADILADYISAYCIKHDLDDSELGSVMIAEAISRARYEHEEGTYLNIAGWVRPADRTIRIAYRRKSGLI